MHSLCLEGFVFYIDKLANEKPNGDKRKHISLCLCHFPDITTICKAWKPEKLLEHLQLHLTGTLPSDPASCSSEGNALRIRQGLLTESVVSREEHFPAGPGKNLEFEASENVKHNSTCVYTMAI